MFNRILIALVLVVCASAGSKKSVTDRNYRVFRGDGTPANLDDVISAARGVSVTFLGETTTTRSHIT
jgi:hypothetical protein